VYIKNVKLNHLHFVARSIFQSPCSFKWQAIALTEGPTD